MQPPNPPPLTRDELLEIQERNREKRDLDIKRLLLEVHRLRQIAAAARKYLIHERPEDRNELLRITSWETAGCEPDQDA